MNCNTDIDRQINTLKHIQYARIDNMLKLLWYRMLCGIPLYGKIAQKKVEKYSERLSSAFYCKNTTNEISPAKKTCSNFELNTNINASKIISSNMDLLNSKLNVKHKDFGKKRILLIGALKYSNKLSLYSNAILKALDYTNTVVHFYDCDSKNLIKVQSEAYEQNENYKEILYSSNLDEIDASQYDISIQIINPEISFLTVMKPAKISYAYIISINDENLLDNINNDLNVNYDAIIFPDKNKSEIFSEHEILLPKFHLPFVIDLNLYERFKFNKNNFKIGFLADIKSIEKYFNLLLPFNGYFKENNIAVEFSYIPSDPNFQREFIEDEKIRLGNIKKLCTDNLILNEAFLYLLPIDIFEKNKEYDLFVYTEESENYIYNPIQTIMAGKCALYPKSYVQASKVNAVGCWSYSCDENLIKAITEFVKNKENLFTDENIKARKSEANIFSNSTSKNLYRSIINPKNLLLGDENKILDDSLQFKEKNLYVKYNYYENRENYEVKAKLISTPCFDVDFGSALNKYVSLLAYANDNEAYIPDWRIIRLIKNRYKTFKDKNFWSFCYGKAEDENVFLKVFDLPYDENIVPQELYQSDIMYEKCAVEWHFAQYNIEREPNLAHKLISLFKDEEYFKGFRNRNHEAFKKYIKVKPEITNKVAEFQERYQKDKLRIGIHIRCDAHSDEWVTSVKAKNYDEYFSAYNKNIEKILKNENIENFDKWCLYIATDNEIALEYFKNKYPDNICFSQDISRLTKEQEKEYENAKLKESRYLVGYELQQRRCIKDSLRSIDLARDILFDILVLSGCDYFIYQSSNVPMTVSYINPNLKMIYAE